jgi:hypothetical protein
MLKYSIIQMSLKEMKFEDMDWIDLDEDIVEHLSLRNTERNIFVPSKDMALQKRDEITLSNLVFRRVIRLVMLIQVFYVLSARSIEINA